jgi:aminomethyltransferase
MPVRDGVQMLDVHGNVVGHITSGSFGPTLGGPVAMGYVETVHAKLGTLLQAIVRGKAVSIEVVKTPFITHRYYRG